jgi:hypothetical protein
LLGSVAAIHIFEPPHVDYHSRCLRRYGLMAKQARDRLKWFKTAFPIHGIGWQLVGPIIGVIVVAAAAAVWLWLRDPAEDFFASDVGKVWHLLLIVGAEGVAGTAFVIWWTRRQMSRPGVPAKDAHYPREIDHFGVKWPIYWPYGSDVSVGKPACPLDRSTLGYVIHVPVEDGEDIDYERVLPEDWEKVQPQLMYFHCFQDASRYDLRQHGYSMAEVIKIVEGQAWGKRRTALAEAEPRRQK